MDNDNPSDEWSNAPGEQGSDGQNDDGNGPFDNGMNQNEGGEPMDNDIPSDEWSNVPGYEGSDGQNDDGQTEDHSEDSTGGAGPEPEASSAGQDHPFSVSIYDYSGDGTEFGVTLDGPHMITEFVKQDWFYEGSYVGSGETYVLASGETPDNLSFEG